jgi:acyl-CoA thioester hydrolase
VGRAGLKPGTDHEWLRKTGFEQTDLAREHGVVFVVRAANIEYLLPARFDDELQVTVELINVGAGQIDLVQRVLRGTVLLVTAAVKLACVARATMRATRIPQPLATRIRMGN